MLGPLDVVQVVVRHVAVGRHGVFRDPGSLKPGPGQKTHNTQHNNTTMVTKDWSTKIDLSRFPNNAHESLMLIKGNISEEKPMTFKNNLHVAIISIFD